MDRLRYKAYIENGELHRIYDAGLGPEEILEYHAPVGTALLQFLLPERSALEELFESLLRQYRLEPQGNPQRNRQALFSHFREPLQGNPYLAGYLWSAILMLCEPGLPNWAVDVFGSAFPGEPVGSTLRRYPDTIVKRRCIQALPSILAAQQNQVIKTLTLLWGQNSQLAGLSPEQRLFVLSRSNSGELPLLKKQTAFRSSLDTVQNYDGLRGDTLRAAVLANPPRVMQMYVFDSLEALLGFELTRMTLERCNVKRCAYCGNWFIPEGRSDSIYCNHIAPGEEKPCAEIGAIRKHTEAVRQAPAHTAYIAAVKRMSKRKGGNLTAEQYKAWSAQAAKLRDQCLAGERSMAEFTAWLDETSRQNRKRGEAE